MPSHARSFGSALLGILDSLSLFISCKIVPTLFERMGMHGAFFMYSAVTIFVAILSFFFMPETSGLSLEEIEDMYRPQSSRAPPARDRIFSIAEIELYKPIPVPRSRGRSFSIVEIELYKPVMRSRAMSIYA